MCVVKRGINQISASNVVQLVVHSTTKL